MYHEFPLVSPAFPRDGTFPRRHAGDGRNLSPPLSWSDPPPGTREFALLLEDHDVDVGEPWVHWVIYNLPATIQALGEGIEPVERPPFPPGATQGINGWETLGYRGPEPARDGKINHYVFTLFALDAPLLLVPGLTRRSLQRAMFGHVLGRAETSGTYPPAGLADPGA